MNIDPLLLIVLLVVPILPTFWAILDIPRRQFASRKMKIVWFLVVSSIPVFGALLYILLVRGKTKPVTDYTEQKEA
ncbi:MAG: PLD nuclease N-terminal domain-containing protein [Acidobacteriota bacterium]